MQVEQGNLGGDEKSLTPIVFINGRFFGYKMTIGYFQKKKIALQKELYVKGLAIQKNISNLDEIFLQPIVF